jgi:hypothetical protein
MKIDGFGKFLFSDKTNALFVGKKKFRGLSLRAKYTRRATAACRRS